MANTIPLGLFSRDRLDWQIESLMLGCAYVAPSSKTPRIGLANNSALGLPLALYAVCAKSGGPTCDLNLSITSTPDAAATISANNLYAQPVIPNVASIGGYITATSIASNTAGPAGVAFRADGIQWFTLPHGPLIVIPVGSAANVVFDIFGSPQAQVQVPLAVSFLWTYYEQAKSTIATARVVRAAKAAAAQGAS